MSVKDSKGSILVWDSVDRNLVPAVRETVPPVVEWGCQLPQCLKGDHNWHALGLLVNLWLIWHGIVRGRWLTCCHIAVSHGVIHINSLSIAIHFNLTREDTFCVPDPLSHMSTLLDPGCPSSQPSESTTSLDIDRSLLESAVKALQSPSELLCGSRPTVRYPCDRQGQLVPLYLRLSNNRIGFGRSSKWVQDFLESMEHELLTTRRQVSAGQKV